jgi:hypothetical protein
MLLEFRFDQLKPRSVPEYEARFLQALPARARLSPLAGFWRTEVGNVDQVVQLWPYESMAQREGVLTASAALQDWAAVDASELGQDHESRLIVPAPFSAPLQERELGSVYELRVYDYEPAAIATVMERWRDKVEERTKLSPLVLCGYSVSARLGQWFHLWAYENALERQRIRAESLKRKIWPPDAAAGLIRQRNMLLTPSSFSPLR